MQKPQTYKTKLATLILVSMPFIYHFGKDIVKMGIKDGKATSEAMAKK